MGTNTFHKFGYKVNKAVKGRKADDHLTLKVREEGWYPVNGKTETYTNETKVKIEKNEELIRDFSDPEFINKAKWKDCFYDFAERYRNGRVSSTDDYF